MNRARGYVRESTQEQGEKYGPDAQRAAITKACAELGLTGPDRWYTDLVSGTGVVKRSDFRQMIADAEAGSFDVLVVYDTSRFARDASDAFLYQKALRAAGVRIFYVMERAWSDEDDRAIVVGLNHVLNEDYIRRLRRKVRDGYAAKFAKHGAPGGTAPWGYRFVDGATRLVATEDAKVRALAVELYATGEFSSRSLADELNRRGHRIYGRPFTQWSIVEILRNPVVIGVTRRHGGRDGERQGAVTPIVSKETWERVVRLRDARRVSDGPTRAGAFVLTGVAVHSCGGRFSGKMRRTVVGKKRSLLHSCETSFNRDEDPYEKALSEWIAEWKLDARQRTKFARFLSGQVDDGRRASAVSRLARAKRLYLVGDISDAEYEREKATARRDIEAPEPARAIGSLATLARVWPKASVEARRAVLGELCERVVLGADSMEMVIREPYRALVAAVAEPVKTFDISAPDHSGRGKWPRQEPQRWARRDSRPRLRLFVDQDTLAERERWLAWAGAA